jgi:hypothetical protein
MNTDVTRREFLATVAAAQISGGFSPMRDSGNVSQLFSTTCPSAIVVAWCMASL